jgi:hypothetical protein
MQYSAPLYHSPLIAGKVQRHPAAPSFLDPTVDSSSFASPRAFIKVFGKHRHPARDQDPPRV